MSIQDYNRCDVAIHAILQLFINEFDDLSAAEELYVLHMVMREIELAAAAVASQQG